MAKTATGTITRVQMQRHGQALVPHANIVTYDPSTGVFTALFDFQAPGDVEYTFTPDPVDSGVFTDQNGLLWTLVR